MIKKLRSHTTLPAVDLDRAKKFYVEQVGVLTAALHEALVQDYDDLLRITPAWPDDWSADATVALHHGGKARVVITKGNLQAVALDVIMLRSRSTSNDP